MADEKRLFNEERKYRYIRKKESEVIMAKNFLRNIFLRSAPFEKKWNKDICEWTDTEIIEFYKYIDVYSFESISLLHSNYGMYTSWCLMETLVPDGQNHFLELDPDVLLGCVNTALLEKTFITREELNKHIDTLPNYTDQFIFHAIFEGICGELYKEITTAKLSDIDENNVIHLCTGRSVPLSAKAIEVAGWAAEEQEYHAYGNKRESIYKYKEDESSDLIFKTVSHGTPGSEANYTRNKAQILQRRYVKSIEFAGLPRQITPKKLMMSGKIHCMKQLIKEENLTLEEVVAKYKDELDERFPVEKFKSIPLFFKKYRQIFE